MCRKLFFVILTLLSVGAAAQHPFSLDWRVLKTPNAKFIYPSYLGFDAARLAIVTINWLIPIRYIQII